MRGLRLNFGRLPQKAESNGLGFNGHSSRSQSHDLLQVSQAGLAFAPGCPAAPGAALPHTKIASYSLKVTPKQHFINWQQDPYGNCLARLVFPEKTSEFSVVVDLVAELTVSNPFDFFLEKYAEEFPFSYEPLLLRELAPYLEVTPPGPLLAELIAESKREKVRTVDYLVEVNQALQQRIKYLIRMEPGIQTPEETLTLKSGSCRDTGWLMVHLLRHLGLATRFVSGYLIQLAPDVKSLDGPSGTEQDVTDLHAWAEVYLPGGGLDRARSDVRIVRRRRTHSAGLLGRSDDRGADQRVFCGRR